MRKLIYNAALFRAEIRRLPIYLADEYSRKLKFRIVRNRPTGDRTKWY
jgi:hypothetical protein